MELTKHAHACVSLEKDGGTLVVDPGALTPNAASLLGEADAVLITHEHFDHVDEDAVAAALAARPGLTVHGPEAVVGRWRAAHPDQVVAVADGDRFTVAGFEVTVHGGVHAEIHRDIPRCANVGYLVDGAVYHPGDSYHVPSAQVGTLLLPTSGPWTKLGEAADFVRALEPRRVVQIHELMLSETGQQSTATFLGPGMLTRVPLTLLPVGETLSL
ncbi:MBL fold metallo-hydrolase [Streptomyces albiaxialis]|uniref:MBL fold metallo-hydrolase n=1 Tax=Streptomyces albiaxialis TaxID=329523 RepID=A0ABP5HA86_9ACTN